MIYSARKSNESEEHEQKHDATGYQTRSKNKQLIEHKNLLLHVFYSRNQAETTLGQGWQNKEEAVVPRISLGKNALLFKKKKKTNSCLNFSFSCISSAYFVNKRQELSSLK